MNLKELIKEVEMLNKVINKKGVIDKLLLRPIMEINKLQGIKQTVEAVDNINMFSKKFKDWQKLKKLLGVK